MKKTIIATIIIACVAVFALGNLAYSFFSTNLAIENALNVGAIFTGNYTPVFTAESEGNLEIEVTDADMLQADGENNNVAVTATGNINVSLDAVGDEKGSTATCSFEFVFEDLTSESEGEYKAYTPSSGITGDSKEFTIEIKNGEGEVIGETAVDKLKDSDTTVAKDELSITSGTDERITKTYTVTAKIYNLNIDQEGIKNKKFGFKINTKNVKCSVDWKE